MNLEEAYEAIRQHAAMYANGMLTELEWYKRSGWSGTFFKVEATGRALALDYRPKDLESIIYFAQKNSTVTFGDKAGATLVSETEIFRDLRRIVRQSFIEAARDAYYADMHIFGGILITELKNGRFT